MENLIKIYDNVVEPHIQDFIENFLLSQIPGLNFPWCYMTRMTGHVDSNIDARSEVGFGISFREKSSLTPQILNVHHDTMLSPLYSFANSQKILIKNIIGHRVYLQTPSPYHGPQSPHVDNFEEHYVCLYYVNDSDGDTIFYDKNKKEFKRVSPKKGRILFFPGNLLHSGSVPFKSTRVVINYNFNYYKFS